MRNLAVQTKTQTTLQKLLKRLPTFVWWRIARRRLGACGGDVHLPRDGTYNLENLYVGNDVHIGIGPFLSAVNSRIYLGDKVAMGPGVMIFAGNRNVGLHGKYMFDVTDAEKLPSDDKDVVIEEDVWVGGNVIITSGVRIGRGSVIGAGSVVRRSVPPYCVVAGNPARVIRARGTIEEIVAHEARLYPPGKRLLPEQLQRIPGAKGGAMAPGGAADEPADPC